MTTSTVLVVVPRERKMKRWMDDGWSSIEFTQHTTLFVCLPKAVGWLLPLGTTYPKRAPVRHCLPDEEHPLLGTAYRMKKIGVVTY
jgi:hypothetical protein